MERQQLNVFRMRLLGAEVREVAAGTATLKVSSCCWVSASPAEGVSHRFVRHCGCHTVHRTPQ